MAGLLDRVITENYTGGFGYEGLSPAIESEIDQRIGDCDDASYMMQYTGECLMGMLAVEAVVMQKEGEVAVEYMAKRANGADTATLEAVVATFEGFLGDAWEKVKEWIKKAYTAIRNFLIKIWNKIKGYAKVVEAFFTKYGDVLRNMDTSGTKVEWCDINLNGAREVYNDNIDIIDNVQQEINTLITITPKLKDNNSGVDSQIKQVFDTNKMPTPHDIQTSLDTKIYGTGGYKPKEVSFSSDKRGKAIEAADINNTQKYINNFLQLGDQGMKYDLDVINTGKKTVEKQGDKLKEDQSKMLAALRRCVNAKLEVHRMCSHALTQAAKRMISQSVAACRKAIMYHHTEGKGATPTADSWNPSNNSSFDDMMATII